MTPAPVLGVAAATTVALVLVACGAAESPASKPSAARPSRNAPPGDLAHDRDGWQQLLVRHADIRRGVVRLPNGMSTVTESDVPAVATLIQDHVRAMKARMDDGRRVRTWDPVFAELFDRHDMIRISVELTAHGARVVETTDDPEALLLLRSHAAAVTEFVREGCPAARRFTPYAPE